MITAADIQTIRKADPGAVLPGIDTMTGNPYATSTLLDLTKITQNTNAPFYYSPSTNSVIVTQSGIVLRGINFGDATVYLEADNVTVEDCTFNGTLRQWAQGAIVKNNTFTGVQSPTGPWGGFIGSNPHITIEDNTFLRAPGDAIDILGIPYWEGITGGGLITGNYFSGAGYEPGAHADAIYVTDSSEPIAITDNLIDGTWSNDAPANANSDIRITNELGSVSNVTVSGNYLLGGGFTFEVWSSNTNYTISNISITNNDVGFDWYGQYYPGTPTLATVSGITTVDFSNPTDSTNALAAYVAAGVPTPIVISGTPGGAGETGTVPTTLLDGYAGAYLGAAGSGETNFVGGYGFQGLLGGQGANILTYLAIGDGGDRMSAFDPAKDVIDLSRIDADITTTGVQNFTFIGSAPFSGGAQVRYQLSPTNDTTIVQAALAGDNSADFTITLAGLVPLTANNFALTSSQSTAALANGAALTYTQVATAAGAPTEYAYSNVQGRAYTTYEAFYGSGYENLEADDLNLSAKENTLVLYDPSQTVTRGGGTETLTVGAGSDPLTYHPVETIDATTSGSEQFTFSAGFGKETIDGFSASGASPDSIQLAKSAFSYLTAGMTQAEDLAAVMAHAARGASGLTITDTRDDSLTLAGITPSMVVDNPAMVQFT
jgi:hypothetical protein